MKNKRWIALFGALIIFPLCAQASFMVSYSDSYYDDHASNLTPHYVKGYYQGQPVYYINNNDGSGRYYYYPRPNNRRHSYVKRSRSRTVDLSVNYAARMPSEIAAPGEKLIMVDPNRHAWGAYTSDGKLIKGGIATAGANWCPDINRRCHTRSGSFRIQSLGGFGCKSTRYPIPRGGAPMPYCMYFNGNQGLHGSYEVVDGNASHGCVRLRVPDAEWIRFNFATIGTKVIVKPY